MQRYFVKNKKNNQFVLDDSDIRHIKLVMRMKTNDKIEIVYDNKLFLCNIDNMDPFSLSIIEENDDNKGLELDITIAIGLVKEQKMDLILQKLTELGVDKIIPLSMERSIVKIDADRFKKKKVRWEAICKEASEQSKRTSAPVIADIATLKELVKLNFDIKLVASTKEKDKKFNNYLQNCEKCAKIIMVIGPEGGISDNEESFLNDNSYDSVSFGNLIFRVETAAIYAASIFNYYSSMR